MKIALSGFAGVGKSSVINKIKNENKSYIITPESAREVKKTENYLFLNDIDKKIFQKSIMDNEFVKINMMLENNFKNIIFDRSIIDNFVFAEYAFGQKNINYKKVQKHIDELRKKYNIDYIYDKNILIKITRNEEFIRKILEDKLRRETTSIYVEDFIKKGILWEKRYIELIRSIKGITETFTILEHFEDNKNFYYFFEKLLKNS